MGLILVSHDLAVVEFLCERVMTMYAGRVGRDRRRRRRCARRPRHPYTGALLHSRLGMAEARRRPRRDPRRIAGGRVVAGGLPVLAALPFAIDACKDRAAAARCARSTGT